MAADPCLAGSRVRVPEPEEPVVRTLACLEGPCLERPSCPVPHPYPGNSEGEAEASQAYHQLEAFHRPCHREEACPYHLGAAS